MIGRAAYYQPAEILGAADREIFGDEVPEVTAEDAVRAFLPYVEAQCAAGTPLHHVARHILGAFAGRPGARAWRRTLSDEIHKKGSGPEVIERALENIAPTPVERAS